MTEHEANALNLFRKFYSKITGIAITSLSVLEPYNSRDFNVKTAKQCAIIAVDEILNCTNGNDGYIACDRTYWQEVKNELNQL